VKERVPTTNHHKDEILEEEYFTPEEEVEKLYVIHVVKLDTCLGIVQGINQ
jgi:hypothetical protein